MPYSTVEDLITSYPRLAATQVTSATLYSWIDRASNYIDAYIAPAVATVPVSPAPPILKNLSEDMAQIMFLKRHSHEAGKDRSLETSWGEILNRLENMRNGTMTILSGSGTVISQTTRNTTPWSTVTQYTPTFGMLEIEDAEVDPDRQDDEVESQ